MPSTRIRALDALRGLMLVIMTVDHLDMFGPVYRLTYETTGFVSAAEGFVLLSGIVAGLVYASLGGQPDLLRRRAWTRVLTIWQVHLIVVAGFLGYFLVYAAARPEGGMPSVILNVLGGAVLLNQEPPLDILPLYIIFVALLPVIIRGFQTGRGRWVLGISFGIWLLDQGLTLLEGYPVDMMFNLGTIPVHWQPNHFHILAWQFLFVGGAWCGWRAAGKTDISERLSRWPWLVVILVGLALCFAFRHGIGVPELSRSHHAVGRVNVGWLRLINVGLVAALAAGSVGRWPRLAHWPWLEFLGRHSLQVFAWQSLLQMFLRPVYLDAALRWGIGARLVLLTLAVASLTIPAWWHQARRRRLKET